MAGNTNSLSTSAVLGTTVSWGVSASPRQGIKSLNSGISNGIVTSWNCTTNYEKADCRNEVGSKIGEVVYDYAHSARATIQCAAGTNCPPPTTVITINEVQFHVVSAETSESNQDYHKMSVTLEASGYKFTPALADSSFNNDGNIGN